MTTDFNKILNRNDYSRLTASLKSKCEEVAKAIRNKMEELDIPNDPNYYDGEFTCAGITVRVSSVKSNVGSYEFLAIERAGEHYGEVSYYSLEDIAAEYYYGGDFTARVMGATNKEALRFLNAAGEIVKALGEIESKQVETTEKAVADKKQIEIVLVSKAMNGALNKAGESVYGDGYIRQSIYRKDLVNTEGNLRQMEIEDICKDITGVAPVRSLSPFQKDKELYCAKVNDRLYFSIIVDK